MRDAADLRLRERVAELAGGRILTEDEEVALRGVAAPRVGNALHLAVTFARVDQHDPEYRQAQDSFHEAVGDALVALAEAWPKRIMLPDAP